MLPQLQKKKPYWCRWIHIEICEYKLQRIILLISLALGMCSHYFINLLFCFDCILTIRFHIRRPVPFPPLALFNAKVITFFADSVEYRWQRYHSLFIPFLPAIFSNIFAFHWMNARKKISTFSMAFFSIIIMPWEASQR